MIINHSIIISIISAAVIFLASACTTEDSRQLPTLDIAANVGCPDKGDLNEIFEFKALVKPELTDSTLMARGAATGIHGNVLYYQEDNRLMTFDVNTGKCLSSFDHTGQGPEDYVGLYFAYPAPDNGDWVAYDMRGQKIVRYTPDGRFVAATPARLDGICPDGKTKWAAQKGVPEGENMMIYIYDDHFNLTDSIRTPLIRYYMESNSLIPFNGRPTMDAADTIYTVTPDNRFEPFVAINLGNYLSPRYKEDEFDKMLAERNNYIRYSFFGDGDLMGMIYSFNDKRTLQFYSLADNSLLFSGSRDKNDYGFTFTHEGNSHKVAPTILIGEDGSFFFVVAPDEDEAEESNPAIMILRPKSK